MSSKIKLKHSKLVKPFAAILFVLAFCFNIQTNLSGEWELVNAGYAQGSGGSSGGSGGCDDPKTCAIWHLTVTVPNEGPPRISCYNTGGSFICP